jgi:hypothetical protein
MNKTLKKTKMNKKKREKIKERHWSEMFDHF